MPSNKNKGSKHFVVAGGGLSGATLARALVESTSCRITILEKYPHVGGHCHTQRDAATGVLLHTFGPHIFNTDIERAWLWMNRFSRMHAYTNRVKAVAGGQVYSFPVNLHTLCQLYGRVLTPQTASALLDKEKVALRHPAQNFEEQALSVLGRKVYETFFQGYTSKQWGCDPRELPASVFKRLPVRMNFDDRYYNSRWEGMPEDGYSAAIQKMLQHEAIEVKCGRAWRRQDLVEMHADHVFFTGPLDAFFDYKYGRLSYRSLRFERIDADGDIQGTAVTNHPDLKVPWTRILEHKHLAPWERHEKSVLFKEYSYETGTQDAPFYPKRLAPDLVLLKRYMEEADGIAGVTFLGRLATYRYLNMDLVIEDALQTAEDTVAALSQGRRPPIFPKSVREEPG